MHYGFITLPRDIGKSLLVGLIIAGIISAAVPKDFFAGALGTGITGMFVMMILGIPIYVCATASVPVAAALILKGASPGAALVFLMTGPATNAAAIAVIWSILGRRTTYIYLLSVAVTALASGFVLDYIFKYTGMAPKAAMPEMLPAWVSTFFAVALLAVLGYAFYKPNKKEVTTMPDVKGQEKMTLTIKGMTCSHCAQSVKNAILSAPGVGSVVVDQSAGKAFIGGSHIDLNTIKKSIEDIGFKLVKAEGQEEH
jgi:copper chaperone CopZ